MVDFTEDFLEKIIDVHWPTKSGFLVIFYFGNTSSSDAAGGDVFHWPDDFGPTVHAPSLNEFVTTEFTLAGAQGQSIKGKTFTPFRNNRTAELDLRFYNFFQATVVAGLKGGPFSVRNSALGTGANGAEVLESGKEIILQGWMTEFGWDHTTAINHIGFMILLYDFLVETGAAPPQDGITVNPATYDSQAITWIDGVVQHSLSISKQSAFVLDLSQMKASGAKSYTLQINLPAFNVGNFNCVAAWTYLKKPPTDNIETPKGWNINPSYTGPANQTCGFNTFEGPKVLHIQPAETPPFTQGVNFSQPNDAEDYREITLQQSAEVATGKGSLVTMTVDTKTLKFTNFDFF